MDGASPVVLSTQGYESVQVLVGFAFEVVNQFVLLVPLDAGEEATSVKFLNVLTLQHLFHLLLNLFADVEAAS